MKIPSGLRRLLERCSREIYFTRRLPARFGGLRLRVSPGASLAYFAGLNRPGFADIYDFAEHHVRPGADVWDIGANVGLFAFAAAARATPSGRVLCLEPDIWSVRLLLRSRALNRGRGAPVEVLAAAASDRLALDSLNIPERGRASAHLASAGGAGQELVGGIRERNLTVTVTLDWLAGHFPAPDVVKIDVDGAERGVLDGGRTLLAQRRPALLVEVYERNADAVSALLHELGYALFDYSCGRRGTAPIERAAYNTLALPRPL